MDAVGNVTMVTASIIIKIIAPCYMDEEVVGLSEINTGDKLLSMYLCRGHHSDIIHSTGLCLWPPYHRICDGDIG